MSAKTKIVVLHMKELLYTGIFALFGILFVILLIMMFLPNKNKNSSQPSAIEDPPSRTASAETVSKDLYVPGIYTTELILGGQTVDVEVIVSKNSIASVRMVNLSDSITTMYPLLQPTLEDLGNQIYQSQSLDNISYTSENKYTSLVLLNAIRSSLEKAMADP